MIRLFSALCKTVLDSLTDKELFRRATDGFRHYDKSCPQCGASGKLSTHGDYSRWLVSYKDEKSFAQRILPPRFKCASCNTTHALLPDVLIPYSQYSLRFKLSVLIAYFQRDSTVTAICEQFEIAVSTLYAWKKLFLSHKELFLGVLLNRKEPAQVFLRGLFDHVCLCDRLSDFFRRHTFSFLQGPRKASRSVPP